VKLAEELVGMAEKESCTDGVVEDKGDEDDTVLLTAASKSSGDGALRLLGLLDSHKLLTH
jgi:hypothetical protein